MIVRRALVRPLRAGVLRPLPQISTRLPSAPRPYTKSSSRRQDAFHSQLQGSDSSAILSSLKSQAPPPNPQTLTEKIIQEYSIGLPEGKYVRAGDYVAIAPHKCMTHDNSWPVALKFMSIGATKVHDPTQLVMTLDHDVQNKSETNLKKYRQIEEFAGKQGVRFYGSGRGIGHQILCEEGYAWPGTLTVASDSHSNMYGGLGCLGTAVVRTDAASIWSTGRTWFCIPPIAKVTLTGVLPPGVTGKDVIVALCGLFNNDEVLNHAIEFTGPEETLRSLPIDDRLTIANMTTEWGALSGLFPIDSVLQGWLRSKATMAALSSSVSDTHKRFNHARLDALFAEPLTADKGATYAKYLHLNLSTLSPYVSGPNSVKVATPLNELEPQNIKIDKAYLVSCTNSRASDIAAAARVIKEAAAANGGKIPRIADGVKFYISAASLPEQEAAEEQGDWQALLDAGAQPLPSGCGPCIGLGTGLLESGEVGISASNRNFKGRMGSREADAYLASPEVVAASALKGAIAGPGWYKKPQGVEGVVRGEGEAGRMISVEEALEKLIAQADELVEMGEREHGENAGTAAPVKDAPEPIASEGSTGLTEILPGFPEQVTGEIVFCDGDNVSTDHVYPGKYTYQDDVSWEMMGQVCMMNYDPEFKNIAKEGDILVSGFNFGCGSSREQAATSILAKGIPLVVSGSFGNIFSRNCINNALMGLEVPKLIQRLRETFSGPPPDTKKDAVSEPQANSETDSVGSPKSSPSEKVLTRRTGWTFTWDVRRSLVRIKEGPEGKEWAQKVGELPPNVQEIIARGGLEKWVKQEISSGS